MISAKEIESRKMSREYDPGLSGLRLVRDILLSLFQLRIIQYPDLDKWFRRDAA